MPLGTKSELRLAVLIWLLACIAIFGAVGLVLLNWEWSGLAAGLAGVVVAVVAYQESRLAGLFAPLGLFAGLTLMEAWQLWRLRGHSEPIDALVVMGLLASLCGLLVGALIARVLSKRTAR